MSRVLVGELAAHVGSEVEVAGEAVARLGLTLPAVAPQLPVIDFVQALELIGAETGEDLAAYDGYLQAFRYGMPPHGGFAIGLERWVARLVGAANVREATLFPRDLTRLSP